jgi:hypothetical protein
MVPAGLKVTPTMFAASGAPLVSSRPVMGTAWVVSSVVRTWADDGSRRSACTANLSAVSGRKSDQACPASAASSPAWAFWSFAWASDRWFRAKTDNPASRSESAARTAMIPLRRRVPRLRRRSEAARKSRPACVSSRR